MASGKEMCELISEYLESKGIKKTWAEIWYSSPTGELYWVYEYYQRAKKWKSEESTQNPEHLGK